MKDEEHERIVDAGESIPVVEGEDEYPVQPAPPIDPYTPEPGPRAGEERAFNVLRWAWIPLAIAALLILIALIR